jgi:hypothetical protein
LPRNPLYRPGRHSELHCNLAHAHIALLKGCALLASVSYARPGLDALMKGVSRRDFDMVLAWSVDRLGRSLTGLLELLTELHAKHVDLYLHQQGLDTSTPSVSAALGLRLCRLKCIVSADGKSVPVSIGSEPLIKTIKMVAVAALAACPREGAPSLTRCVSPRFERDWLRRGPEHRYRIPVGKQSARTAARVSGRVRQ